MSDNTHSQYMNLRASWERAVKNNALNLDQVTSSLELAKYIYNATKNNYIRRDCRRLILVIQRWQRELEAEVIRNTPRQLEML